jgi:hypothetical protein
MEGKIIQIAAGAQHALALSETGYVVLDILKTIPLTLISADSSTSGDLTAMADLVLAPPKMYYPQSYIRM